MASASAWGSGGGVVTKMVSVGFLTMSNSWTVIEVVAQWLMGGEGGSSLTLAEGGMDGLSLVVVIGSVGGGVGSLRRYSSISLL